jgi:hypothetical protein
MLLLVDTKNVPKTITSKRKTERRVHTFTLVAPSGFVPVCGMPGKNFASGTAGT